MAVRELVETSRGVLAIALLLAACVSIGISLPNVAIAQDLSFVNQLKQNMLSMQDDKVTVYVLASGSRENAALGFKESDKYSYYSSGLLKKKSFDVATGAKGSSIWKYDSSSRLKSRMDNGLGSSYSFSTNAAGVIKSEINTVKLNNGNKWKRTRSYKISSGKVVSYVSKEYIYSKTTKKWTVEAKATVSVAYKAGKVVSVKSGSAVSRYAYDSKGNLKRYTDSNSSHKFNSSYNSKSLLVNRIDSYSGSKLTETYKYRPIKVSRSMAKRVKAQQWALLNNNLNCALGGF